MQGNGKLDLVIMVVRLILEFINRCGEACTKPFSKKSEEDNEEENNQS